MSDDLVADLARHSSRSRAVAPWLVWTLALVEAGLIGLAPLLFRPQFAASITDVSLEFVTFLATIAVVVMVFATAGALVTRRQPGNLVGWLMLVGGPALGCVFLGYLVSAVLADSDPATASWFVLAASVMFGPGLFVLGPVLACVFPTGRPLPGWWGRAVWLGTGAIIVGAVIAALAPGQIEETMTLENPVGIRFLPDGLRAAGNTLTSLALGVGALVGPASLIVRFRRSSTEVRHQLKWFLCAGLIWAVVMPVSLLVGETWTAILALAALGLVPVAVVVSVLRYRLYEIDTLINRTLVYVPLVGVVAGMYSASVVLLQRVFTALTGDSSDAAAVISALFLAAVFTPIRNGIQSAVDRRFKPAESDAASKWSDPEFRAAVESIVRDVVDRTPDDSLDRRNSAAGAAE